MITGALDTSHGFSLALADGGNMIVDDRREPPTAPRESHRLAVLVQSALRTRKLTIGEVVRWTVGTGPGSFTGIRTGIAFLAGACLRTGAELRGLPSSLAGAMRAAETIPEKEAYLAVLNDARQQQFIATVYRKSEPGVTPVSQALVVDPRAVPPLLFECSVLVSVQAQTIRRLLPEPLASRLTAAPTVDATAFLQVPEWPRTRTARETSLNPVYVRPPVFVNS